MKIVFFGNTKYSLIGAKIIHDELKISLVATIKNSPLEKFALEQKIPLITADKLDEGIIEQISSSNPDFLVVEDYGLILPKKLLVVPKLGAINIHHSLLPAFRGPSPAPSAILAGEVKSGVTIIRMSENVDAGDIYGQVEYELKSGETTDSLLTRLNELGAKLAVETIRNITEGAKPTKQNENEATFTNYMKRGDGFIDINNPPSKEKLDRMIRAYYPWPGVYTKYQISNDKYQIIKLLPGGRIQVEGKRPMNLADFKNGYKKGDEFLKKLGLD